MLIHKPFIYDCQTEDILNKEAAHHIINSLADFNAEQGVVRLAVSGGSSPMPILERISRESAFPWDRIELYLTDERYVDKSSKDSNTALISKTLGKDMLVELGEYNDFNTSLPVDMTVKNYAEKLETLDGPLFDLVVLGVGPDGHIASLFPGGNYYQEPQPSVLETAAPPEFAVARRVTLSVKSILDSQEIILIIKGESKADVLRNMLEGKHLAVDYPVKFLLAHPKLSIYNWVG